MAGEAWQFAGSLAAVAVMIALAWRFGFAGRPVLADEAEARTIAQGLPGGFAAQSVVLDASGHGALLRDDRARIAAVLPHGAHFVARLVVPASTVEHDGGRLTLRLPGCVAHFELGAAQAADWAAAIDRLE